MSVYLHCFSLNTILFVSTTHCSFEYDIVRLNMILFDVLLPRQTIKTFVRMPFSGCRKVFNVNDNVTAKQPRNKNKTKIKGNSDYNIDKNNYCTTIVATHKQQLDNL